MGAEGLAYGARRERARVSGKGPLELSCKKNGVEKARAVEPGAQHLQGPFGAGEPSALQEVHTLKAREP